VSDQPPEVHRLAFPQRPFARHTPIPGRPSVTPRVLVALRALAPILESRQDVVDVRDALQAILDADDARRPR
jgi:hypothetical protein